MIQAWFQCFMENGKFAKIIPCAAAGYRSGKALIIKHENFSCLHNERRLHRQLAH
jgi:hypothetical protein